MNKNMLVGGIGAMILGTVTAVDGIKTTRNGLNGVIKSNNSAEDKEVSALNSLEIVLGSALGITGANIVLAGLSLCINSIKTKN